MTKNEAINWLINITADIGKVQHQDLWHYGQALSEIREMLEETADVVEVVRCKDCKHNPNDTWFECPMVSQPYKEDRWCWKGERKDG